ncbi:MAG TPA: hypothetical protein VGS07_22140 [Thermoanaerobaculia bacterium]|jgi:hypothetical protein|nr:hypothetical protein [Thermoanaerobaculia bacterium]
MAKKVTDPTKKTRSKILRQKEKFQVWRNVATATATNASELTGTEARLSALESVLTEVDKILSEQAAFQASKQMTSQRLKALVNQGDKLTTVLKAMAKQHYGNGNDKLVEFGIQPLRSRPKPTVVPSTPPPPEPGPSGPTPTTP